MEVPDADVVIAWDAVAIGSQQAALCDLGLDGEGTGYPFMYIRRPRCYNVNQQHEQ